MNDDTLGVKPKRLAISADARQEETLGPGDYDFIKKIAREVIEKTVVDHEMLGHFGLKKK